MKKTHDKLLILVFLFLFCFGSFSCRKDPSPVPEEQEQVLTPQANPSPKGFYLLNEANMNSNKASLDFLDYTTGLYRRNIYGTSNPEIALGLGDVGNDLSVYGSKLYVVLNASNKIEVLDAKTTRRIKVIDINNPRYLIAHEGKIYASAYLGKIGDANAPNGIVVEIDTTTLEIARRVTVGRQPEELAVVDHKIYVANSGGYSPPDYERTISVIDINSFIETKRIDVDINLHRLKVDQYGDIYVSSRGDYLDIPSKLYVIDTKTDRIKTSFPIAVSQFIIQGDWAYIYSSSWSYITGKNEYTYQLLDIKNEELLTESFISEETAKNITEPYGIATNPATGELYITDAKNYVVPGTLYCIDTDGNIKWSVTTGDIPAHFAFVY